MKKIPTAVTVVWFDHDSQIDPLTLFFGHDAPPVPRSGDVIKLAHRGDASQSHGDIVDEELAVDRVEHVFNVTTLEYTIYVIGIKR